MVERSEVEIELTQSDSRSKDVMVESVMVKNINIYLVVVYIELEDTVINERVYVELDRKMDHGQL